MDMDQIAKDLLENSSDARSSAAPEVPARETFPEALLKEANLLVEQARRLEAELSRLLRGFFHAKGIDPETDAVQIDLSAGTYHLAPPSPAE